MKNIILFLFFLLAVMTTTWAQAPGDPDAPEEGEVITGIVAFESSIVYSGPDFPYRILGEFPINASVTVLGRRGDFTYSFDGSQWLEVAYDGGSAWVYARLIRTSVPFNSIPPTGRALPRNRDGRVPEAFDLTDDVCDSWVGEFTQSSSVLTKENNITVTFPALNGATTYTVIAIAPSGFRSAFDTETPTATIVDDKIRSRNEYGTYTWRVAPYWSNDVERYTWQQICLLQTGGTFERVAP
jgi:hypothetical protein